MLWFRYVVTIIDMVSVRGIGKISTTMGRICDEMVYHLFRETRKYKKNVLKW